MPLPPHIPITPTSGAEAPGSACGWVICMEVQIGLPSAGGRPRTPLGPSHLGHTGLQPVLNEWRFAFSRVFLGRVSAGEVQEEVCRGAGGGSWGGAGGGELGRLIFLSCVLCEGQRSTWGVSLSHYTSHYVALASLNSQRSTSLGLPRLELEAWLHLIETKSFTNPGAQIQTGQ